MRKLELMAIKSSNNNTVKKADSDPEEPYGFFI